MLLRGGKVCAGTPKKTASECIRGRLMFFLPPDGENMSLRQFPQGLFADSRNTRKHFALKVFEHCSAACGHIADFLGVTHLGDSSH